MKLEIRLWLLALLPIILLNLYIRMLHPDYLVNGFYLQRWSSNQMMQFTTIQKLHDAPLATLYYLHIQPPMLDTIRAVLAAFSPYGHGKELLHFVDGEMYVVWAGFYATMAVLIFTWIRAATGSTRAAGIAYACWLPYPGVLAMGTYLDGTMLSSLIITWMLYEVWLVSYARGSERRTSCSAIVAFLTRTVFQWPFVLVLVVALKIAGASWKSTMRITLPLLLVVVIYLFKQWMLFDTLSTTTFAGEHKIGFIQYVNKAEEKKRREAITDYHYPEEAARHEGNYNTKTQVLTNIADAAMGSERFQCCFMQSMRGVAHSISLDFKTMHRPVARFYNSFPYINLIPWEPFYDYMSVYPLWAGLVAGAIAWTLRNRKRMRMASRQLAPAFIAAFVLTILLLACARYAWSEADRLKFLLEPTAYIFVVTQLIFLWREIAIWRKEKAQARIVN